MTASLAREGADLFVICKPCDMTRYEPNRKRAEQLMTTHNHTKHKEN